MSPNTIHAPAYSAPELGLLVTDYVGFQEDESILRLWLENAHHAHAPAALPGRRALHADDAGVGVLAARTVDGGDLRLAANPVWARLQNPGS